MQAHDLHQHLIGVGGAVEGAGAGRVIRTRFRFQQLGAAGLAFRIGLAHFRFLLVADAAGHRTAGHEHARQMTEAQRADQQARHDLVADAQVQRAIEHVVRQRHGGGHGDQVAREQRQLHARATLRHAIAHRRYAAGHLRGEACFARNFANQRRIALIRLMRREHVVVRGDDADVRRVAFAQCALSCVPHAAKPCARLPQERRARCVPSHGSAMDTIEIGGACIAAAFAQALGDFGNNGMQTHLQLQPAWRGVNSLPLFAGGGWEGVTHTCRDVRDFTPPQPFPTAREGGNRHRGKTCFITGTNRRPTACALRSTLAMGNELSGCSACSSTDTLVATLRCADTARVP